MKSQAPSSDRLTNYDLEHFTAYMQLLDAAADGANLDEMARDILGLDPMAEPIHARKAVQSHLGRARWILNEGYKELFPEAGLVPPSDGD